jgi:hypothetical protein
MATAFSANSSPTRLLISSVAKSRSIFGAPVLGIKKYQDWAVEKATPDSTLERYASGPTADASVRLAPMLKRSHVMSRTKCCAVSIVSGLLHAAVALAPAQATEPALDEEIIGNYGEEFWIRSGANLIGIWANNTHEVIYFICSPRTGAPISLRRTSGRATGFRPRSRFATELVELQAAALLQPVGADPARTQGLLRHPGADPEKFAGSKFSRQPRRGQAQGCA